MSKPIPDKTYYAGEVVELVGNNFYEFVSNKEKDVFVLYYVPWCQYCNQTIFD